jgi:NADH-quinone oxidoreductase subunit L
MEGPTPVSALIHAATMVAAGVYLVGRMYPVFSGHPLALPIVCGVGTFTALFAGTMAVTATDIKKVLAYSTVSQLGFMFAGLGAGGITGYYAGMFHLVTHAFFKACLFLGSGSVIHAVHTQEIGQMGGLRRKLPVTFWTWTIATLAIAGFPFTAGFFSKDSILLALAIDDGPYALFRKACMGALVAGAFLTAAYMTRVTWLTFLGEPRERERYEHAHESKVLTVPLVFLAAMAIAAGYAWHGNFLQPQQVYGFGYWPGVGLEHLEGAAKVAAEALAERHHHWHSLLYFIAIPAGVGGIAFGAFLYGTAKGAELRAKVRGPAAPLLAAWKAKYWIDEIYDATVFAGSNAAARVLAWWDREVVDGLVNAVGRAARRVGDASGWVDREIVDGQFVHGAAGVAWGLGGAFSTMQGGKVRVYLYQAVLATAALALVLAAAHG